MNNPKITVYITSYNYEKYIEKAIQSVLHQTLQDFELLIFDDGSTDNSREIIKKYENHPKIKVIYQENQGMPKTCNKALGMAQGDYIIRLDADDYFDENILLVLSHILDTKPDVGLVYPDYFEIDENNHLTNFVRRKKLGKESKHMDLPAHGACTMIRKKCLDEIGGYSEDIKCQDGYDLWIKFIQKFEPYNVNVPLFYYRKHSQSSTTHSKKILETRKVIKNKFVEKNNIQKKTCLIIPIRRNSRIYEDLPLKKINNKHLMDYVIDEAVKTGVDKVIVTTEDQEIAEIIKNKGLDVIVRPKELSGIGTPIEPTVNFVLENLEKNKGFIPDIVGVLFFTSPLIKSKHLQEAINTLIIYNADSVVSVTENSRLHYNHDQFGLRPLFQKRAIKDEREFLYEESGAFIFSKRNVVSKDKFVGQKISHVILTENESIDIENKFTYWLVEQILKNKEQVEKLDIQGIMRGV